MDRWEQIRQNIANNTAMWIGIWILIVLNIFALISMSYGFSWSRMLVFVLLCIAGIMGIILLAAHPKGPEVKEREMNSEIDDLMQEIRPLCDELFVKEIDRITEPVIKNTREDFKRGLNYLWEDSKAYLQRLRDGVSEVNVVIQLINSISDSNVKIVQKLQENLEILEQTTHEIERNREKSTQLLDQSIEAKSEDLKKSMEKEKDIFYDYVRRLLQEQVRNSEEGFDILEYFNMDKLGEQFSVVIEKSVQARLAYFEDALIRDIENISADIVGTMQKGALQLLNIFKEIEDLIDTLIDDCSSENNLANRRLNDSRQKIHSLREEANEIMLSLSWQDILLEKRWQDIEERLNVVKGQVTENVSEDVIQYLGENLQTEIPALAVLTQTSANMVLYKSLLDAEIVYQVYEGRKLPEILEDGSYALLQFIRPVEMLAVDSIRLKESHLQKKRSIKEQVKKGAFESYWRRVIAALDMEKEDLLAHLDGVYPRAFSAFCNSPYIKKRPDNIKQAAWMMFLRFMDQSEEEISEESYLLVGLLLCIYQLRNSCIHPLKSTPLALSRESDLSDMRCCAHRAVEILLKA